MASSQSSPHRPNGHKITPVAFGASLLGFILVAILSGVLVAGLFVPAVGAVGAFAKAAPASFREIPDDFTLVEPSEESRMVDSEGKHMAQFYSSRRQVLNSDQISDNIRKAVIAIEDKTFPTHRGIDLRRILGALVHNLTSPGKGLQGASTITQQYVKNSLLELGYQTGDEDLIDEADETSNERKLREVKYALAIESQLTKDEILTGYLNIAAFGSDVYGVGAASRAYFSIPASEVNIGQAALLAGIVQSPVQYDPLVNPEASQKRRDIVLGEMLGDGVITREEYDEAKSIPVVDMLKPEERPNGCRGAGSAAYYCDYVIEEFLSDPAFGETRIEREHLLQTGGLVLRTSLNRQMQDTAWSALTDLVPVNHPDGVNDALTAIDFRTGKIQAMAQNTIYGIGENATEVSFNTYTGGGRGFQPGSTFKTFTLVQWFKEGHSIYETVGRNDRNFPVSDFKCDGMVYGAGPYLVNDLPGKDGPREAQQMVNLSINQGFVDMASKVDYCKIFEGAGDLGLETWDGEKPNPINVSGIIGGSDQDFSPLLMASAYGTIANEGVRCPPIALTEVADRDGKVIKTYEPNCQQVLDPTVAKQVATVLKTTANQYQNINVYGQDYAAKTGTTDNNSNNWVIGFTPQLVTAMWVGFGEGSSKAGQDIVINGEWVPALYGETFVGPGWSDFMNRALDGVPYESIPSVFVGNRPPPPPVERPETENRDQEPRDEPATPAPPAAPAQTDPASIVTPPRDPDCKSSEAQSCDYKKEPGRRDTTHG